MEEWVRETFASGQFQTAMLPAAVLLGAFTAMGSCCNYAMWAAAAGFAASREGTSGYRMLLAPLGFIAGAMVFMGLVGAGVGVVGEVLGSGFRFWGMLLAGVTSVGFALLALGLLPVRVGLRPMAVRRIPAGALGAALFGAAVGGTSMACSICCGAGLPVVLGMAASTGQGGWGASILAMFALGFGLPFAGAMYGVSLGRTLAWGRRFGVFIQRGAALLLLAAGFWMLASLVH